MPLPPRGSAERAVVLHFQAIESDDPLELLGQHGEIHPAGIQKYHNPLPCAFRVKGEVVRERDRRGEGADEFRALQLHLDLLLPFIRMRQIGVDPVQPRFILTVRGSSAETGCDLGKPIALRLTRRGTLCGSSASLLPTTEFGSGAGFHDFATPRLA